MPDMFDYWNTVRFVCRNKVAFVNFEEDKQDIEDIGEVVAVNFGNNSFGHDHMMNKSYSLPHFYWNGIAYK